MTYKVKINGKEYNLPARTLAVDEQMLEVSELGRRCSSGEITYSESVKRQHTFVNGLAPGAFPSLEETDINELTIAVVSITSAYTNPSVDAVMGERMKMVHRALNSSRAKNGKPDRGVSNGK